VKQVGVVPFYHPLALSIWSRGKRLSSVKEVVE
jgi:hypothetical protein